MKKKLALIVISLDECFTEKGFSGGGHKVTKNLILGLVDSGLFDIDIYCQSSSVKSVECINSINVLSKRNFKKNLKKRLELIDYDYILSSDILLPFANNLIHSNSSKYKSKNGKNKFLQGFLKFYNRKKIKTQQENMPSDKAVFAVSQSLKDDYVSNFSLDEDKVFVCYPAVDNLAQYSAPLQNSEFVIGGMAGGGLNKGGYLLLLALKELPKDLKWKAKIIFPKIKKSFFFRMFVKFLGLDRKIEVVGKQKDMDAFYKSIDCYVLPSLNEAFGLVVTEAASNFKPSLVSSTTGVCELVEDGVNGFVFERRKNAVSNLSAKLSEIINLYFNDYEKFIEISKNASDISEKLNWKKFVGTIIENMIEEDKN